MRAIILGASLAVLASTVAAQDARPIIASETDLPATRFHLPGLPSEVLNTPALLTEVLPPVRAEAERVLRDYDIQDPTIATGLRVGLLNIAWLDGRPDDVLRLVAEQRAAETKPQLRQVGQLTREALAAGQLAPASERCDAVAARVNQTLASADPLLVRDEVLRRYGQVQVVSPAFHIGSAALGLDPEAKTRGSLDTLGALALASMRVDADGIPACRSEMATALKTWLDDPAHQPIDIWPEREIDPATLADATPVTVAIWESGYDPSLFEAQQAIDPAEPLDGRDNDGNGVVDDAFGPTFDTLMRPTRDRMLLPSPEFAARLGLQTALEKGLSDLGYGDDTPEARFVAQRSREAAAAEQIADVRVATEWNNWAHGTWVASLIADGAPFVRLYAVNVLPFNDNPDPVPFVEEDAERMAALLPGVASRLRGAGVRVVNMSWGSTADEWASHLLETGREMDPEKATERGRAIARIIRDGVDALIRDSPDILFVAGAGNSDQSDASQAATPQTLDRPNLLTVGGAGRSGNATAFTTYGTSIRLYALAEGNVVRAPGGQVMRRSGTSFAGPLAARAAAAMLAANPELTPVQVIEGLVGTARGEAASTLPLLDTGAAVRWAQARR